ncbi:MAG: N-acetyl-gamma-glutamyl-phosphate reductase [Saprospiraceae bacterium]|jgi:N-acetyl-gamma-glutamyl-phosphate reductase
MKSVGIVGGAGYVGGELIRILLHHPEVEIKFISSRSQSGRYAHEIHRDLLGSTDIRFTEAYDGDVDVLFLAMGHGKSLPFLDKIQLKEGAIVIDLSRDYRLKADAKGFVYGLCEMNKSEIKTATRIANPGCFATCIQLTLLPLAKAGILENDIHITAITGSTGAGQAPSATTHFSWRNNNISVYKPFTHQHLDEINQSIEQLQESFAAEVNFIPMRGDFARGIFASVYMNSDLSESEAHELFDTYYHESPFVHRSANPISVKDAVNTNNGLLYVSKIGNKLRIESAIDNLLKGAAGQAVQNMNLIMKWDERLGLGLKANAF